MTRAVCLTAYSDKGNMVVGVIRDYDDRTTKLHDIFDDFIQMVKCNYISYDVVRIVVDIAL